MLVNGKEVSKATWKAEDLRSVVDLPHDGRVSFFITSMDSKTVKLSYYARALRSGTFTALPAEVSAMYDLTQWGRSDTATVEVKQK